MPPKDELDLLDGTLYFEDESGELKPIIVVHDVELTTDTYLEDIIPEEYRLPTAHEFSFSLENTSWFGINLFKLRHVNNYRRLHGLRPIRRKTWKHKPKSISVIVTCKTAKE